MANQKAVGNQNIQIQNVVGSSIQITYGGRARNVPLEPAAAPVGAEVLSPARLVRARSGVVPYSAREGLLDELEDWLDVENPFAGYVIGGRGGSGKTRLAVELCEHADTKNWLCGLLMTRDVDRGGVEELAAARVSRLVVVDYAEARAVQMEVVLPLLRAEATVEYPVRVLLLVRASPQRSTGQVEDWKKGLCGRTDPLDNALDECPVKVLDDMALKHSERDKLFSAAARAFAERLDPPVEPPASPEQLEKELFESPLLVVIAAYLAVHGKKDLPMTKSALLDELLAHELRYWRATGSDLFGKDDVLPGRVVALATLTGAEDEPTAATRLCLLSDFKGVDAERRGKVARWANELYPGPGWWNPLEPDLVGEHLVAETFTEQPGVLEGVLDGEDPHAITRPLEVYARAAADHERLAAALKPILSGKLRQLCEVAVAQALTETDRDLLYGNTATAAAAIDRAITTIEVDPDVLPTAANVMPRRSDLILSPLALTLTAQIVEDLRALATASPAEFEPDLASSLNSLSVRLGEAGRRDEGLAAVEESVEVYRRLATASPAEFEPDLAMSLNNLSVRLGEAGRRDEGLAAVEESVEIRRRLVAANPAEFEPALAGSLNNLSARLRDVGRSDEALAAVEESVEVYRRLARASPAVFEPDLAMSLNNLSINLGEAGRRDEGLTEIEESVEVYRRLATASPAAFEPNLAMSLTTLSNRLGYAGRRDEALAAVEESVEVYRRLATASPAAFEPNLAMSLNNLSVHLGDAGRRDEGLAAADESVEICRRLAAASPAVFEPALAMSLNNLSLSLREMGRDADAERVREELIALSAPSRG